MARVEHQFRIAEIEVAKHPADDKIVGIFRFESTGPTKHGPLLLIIAEIHSTLYVYERLLDAINATADQARHLIAGVGQDPVSRFEKLVQRLNEAVATFGKEEGMPLSWNRINIYVMELSEGHICLTGIGNLMNMFLQKQEDGTFRSFDLFRSMDQPGPVDPAKPFASLICGDIKPGDLLIAGSSNLDRLRSELRMRERLSTLPPVTAALEIRQDLEKRGIPDNFVAAVIVCTEHKAPPEPVAVTLPKVQNSTESIEQMHKNEQETNQRLSPVIAPLAPMEKAKDWKELATNALGRLKSVAASVMPKRGGERPREAMALQSLRGLNAGYGSMFTKQRKLVLGVGAAVIVLIIAGVLWWNHSKKVAAEIAGWNGSFDTAQDNRNRAESDLIYGNEAQARKELATADDILKTLPTDNPDREAKIAKLKQVLSDLHEKLKRVVNIDGVTELASLGPSVPEGSLSAVALVKDTAYAVDASGSVVLKINLSTKETTRIPLPAGASNIVSAAEGTTSILFATKDGKLFALGKSDDSISAMPWNHAKSSSTVDIVLYASKVYSLDPQNSQVWRSQNSGSGFGGEASYIKASNASLDTAVSLAIDSNVYVLKNDGTLLRFLSGGQEGFALGAIDPVLRAASGIWADVDSSYIYITDPADRRILVFDKNGALKAQLTSPQILSPRDISVDEANKRAIVLDGNRLLLMPLQ